MSGFSEADPSFLTLDGVEDKIFAFHEFEEIPYLPWKGDPEIFAYFST